ncbi:coiled-coil domain-containing protein R3HCC1L-like [Mytilus trossulus]|uniref:coiled-coil domain-containing protein R3HCC1L-like n=1 Tax=Mytilus trossulus TaxID=6551 RepID=UPI003005A35D
MSNPKPSVGRGRARGRVKDGDSPGISPVGVRQSGIPDSEHHNSKPEPQRSKGRGKKPEVQLYVPRGRRSQESSCGNSQSEESQSLQSNSSECDQLTISELKKPHGGTTESHDKTDDIEKNLTSSDIKPVQTKPRKSRTAQVYMPPGRRREQEKGQSLSESSERGSDGDQWDADNADTHNIDTEMDTCCKNEEELVQDVSSFKIEDTKLSVCKTSEHLNPDISLRPETNDDVHICQNIVKSEHDTENVSAKVHDKLDTESSDLLREQTLGGNQSNTNNQTNIQDSIENNEHSNNHDNSGNIVNSDISDDITISNDGAPEQHEQSDNLISNDTVISSEINRTEECISISHDSGASTQSVQSGEVTRSHDKTVLDACSKKDSSDQLGSEKDEKSLQSVSDGQSNHSKSEVPDSWDNEDSDSGSHEESTCSAPKAKKTTNVESKTSEKPEKDEKKVKNSSKVIVRNDKLAAFGWDLYTDETNESTAERERAESEEKDDYRKKSGKKKTGKGKNKLKKKLDSPAESVEIDQQEIESAVAEKKPVQSDEDASWDTMFDDDGDSLDPNTLEELSGNVGKVKVKKPVINYLNYQPKEPELDYEGMNHVIEIFDFSSEMKTEDLLSAFSMFKSKGFDIKWVDDTHALGVFSSVIAANEALQFTHPLLKVGPLSLASRESKVKAKKAVEFLQPYKERPETTAVVARRMLTGALGLKTKVSKEQREKETEEKRKLKQAKDKKKQERKQKDDIWEGNVTSE